ncbi:hypothetical protein B4102_1715 [Heyndrickxia sporothermodurans]|uniref:Uncharacterized protein n=1 Tax=Heyndrickxia sporothermodurans TaxID=46224 RepID=A0A150LFW3_9BACI|nr:hypothetical protein B4102_1715 [Heyndrickxia sporothermodurans]
MKEKMIELSFFPSSYDRQHFIYTADFFLFKEDLRINIYMEVF